MNILKNKKILIILTMILGLSFTLSLVYFVYYYKDIRENSMSTGVVSIDFNDSNNLVTLNSNVPMLDDVGIKITSYEFKIKNTSRIPIKVNLKIELDNETNIPLGAIRYGLFIDDKLIKKDYVHDDLLLYTFDSLLTEEEINCKLRFWVDYYYEEPEKVFKAKIKVDGENSEVIVPVLVENFPFKKEPYTYTVPYNGEYQIELWGAQGGGQTGGHGAYVTGVIYLEKDKEIYVYVGENPTYVTTNCYSDNPNDSFNGSNIGSCSGGGGASDVRLLKTENWYDEESLRSRIIVAGAGGGQYSTYQGYGGYGGELTGGEGYDGRGDKTPKLGGNQLQYNFGFGQKYTTISGSGYYSGEGGQGTNAGGGSSYISGYLGCIAIKSQSETTPICTQEEANTNIACSYHYSGYKFSNMRMIGGNKEMPSPNGTKEKGHTKDGYARISLIRKINK